MALAIGAVGASTALGADDEDVALPPGMEEDNADFGVGAGAAPANSDSIYHRDIRMMRPQSAGDGCPAGTMQAVLSPDAKTLSLLFDNFVSTAGGSSGARRMIRSCQVAVPFEVPAGMQVQVVKLDFRGFNSIPSRGRTRYITAYYYSDAQTGEQVKRAVRRRAQFQGPLHGDYMLSANVPGARAPWSACGRNVNLNIRSRIVAASPDMREETMATIDSVDIVANPLVEYHLRWRPCAPANGGGGAVFGPGPAPGAVPPPLPGPPGHFGPHRPPGRR